MKKVILYVNQFFAGIGGEEQADFEPCIMEGAVGPAFQSGRYGMSCGEICKYVNQHYGISAITCMNPENPGVDAYRETIGVYIMKGNKSASKMRVDAGAMAGLANKMIKGEEILWADAEGYFGHGIRKEVFVEKTASDRVVDMLLKKKREVLLKQNIRSKFMIMLNQQTL